MIDAPLGDRIDLGAALADAPDHFVPIGKARIAREGTHVTVVSYGRTCRVRQRRPTSSRRKGSMPRSSICARSIRTIGTRSRRASTKTHRVLCRERGHRGHELRRAPDSPDGRRAFYELYAPPKLLAGARFPGIGLADNLEMASVPQKTASRRRSPSSPPRAVTSSGGPAARATAPAATTPACAARSTSAP